MTFLLDTCVLSETTKSHPAPRVVKWLESVDDSAIAISVLTLGELEKGVDKLRSSGRKRALGVWLEEIRSAHAARILDVTESVAREWGRLSARSELRGVSLPVIDALIGATALVHELTVVTRNTSDIARTEAPTFDPWR